MADEPHVIRGINWREAFPFTLIFRTFRVAIHPSKLVLALLALLAIYFGGRIMDAIWPANSLAVPGELGIYLDTRTDPNPAESFRQRRAAERKQIVDRYHDELNRIKKPDGDLDDIEWRIREDRNRAADQARDAFAKAPKDTPEARKNAERARDAAIRDAYTDASARWRGFELYSGVGLFDTMFQYQLGGLHRVVHSGRLGQWIGHDGMLDRIVDFLTIAPGWAFRHHPVYFLIFFIYCLIIWAIFGGAISRIAAVQVARDEKISFRQALSFSTAKFLSFLSAPIIPLLIIVAVGLIVAVGGLLLNIPALGPILVGALFFLALAAGFVMTLVLLGLLGGFNLMYPTIAVEGSDSFDAISRSFSYLYARPWRLLFYTLVAVIYGVLTYAFVRYFLLLLLSLTHGFAGAFVFTHANSTDPLWPTLWPDPMPMGHLTYQIDFLTLTWAQYVGALLLSIWVYLAISMLGAFAISFYFSANTIIYLLMRHEVDATEMDDVYLEQTEEDLAETPAPGAAAPAGETAPAPAAPAPASETPGEQGAQGPAPAQPDSGPPPADNAPPSAGQPLNGGA